MHALLETILCEWNSPRTLSFRLGNSTTNREPSRVTGNRIQRLFLATIGCRPDRFDDRKMLSQYRIDIKQTVDDVSALEGVSIIGKPICRTVAANTLLPSNVQPGRLKSPFRYRTCVPRCGRGGLRV